VSDVHISGVKAGNVGSGKARASCYQALVILGPVAFDYNGTDPASVVPVNGVSISDSDFGTPSNAAQPWYLYNVRGLTLRNVTIAGTVHNRSLSA
jgi:hypothetical protein